MFPAAPWRRCHPCMRCNDTLSLPLNNLIAARALHTHHNRTSVTRLSERCAVTVQCTRVWLAWADRISGRPGLPWPSSWLTGGNRGNAEQLPQLGRWASASISRRVARWPEVLAIRSMRAICMGGGREGEEQLKTRSWGVTVVQGVSQVGSREAPRQGGRRAGTSGCLSAQ
jgi:hypothetical protein